VWAERISVEETERAKERLIGDEIREAARGQII